MGESSPGPSTTIKALENEVGSVEERSCWTPVLVGYELFLLVAFRIYGGGGHTSANISSKILLNILLSDNSPTSPSKEV
jgi:hypothetical protein